MLKSHNGVLTLTSTKTGEHKTFRIKTQRKESLFAPGARVVALLTGPNNTSDYKGFGFVNEEGHILVWRKLLGTAYEKYARMLEKVEEHQEAGNLQMNFEGHCRKCNRLLTTPESVASGIGPVCARRK